ncbi:MAG: hypothetical protein IKD46_02050 [Lentisphaeria bacterium]|nr:hypothetical protein [Lentisphaeria bacterium]
MKHLWMLALMLCGGALLAGTDVDVNGKFAGSNVGDKTPKKWLFNKSISPVGSGEVVRVGDKLGVKITNTAKSVAYYSYQIPVKAGEKYEMSCDVTGNGKAYLAMYFYAENGAWAGAVSQPAVVLKAGENELKYTFTIPADIKGKVPCKGSFVFYLSGPGEATYYDVEVEKEDDK